MICGRCPEGRRFAQGSTFCVLYGIIISDKHECTLEGGKRHDRTADDSEIQRTETEIRQSSGGAA